MPTLSPAAISAGGSQHVQVMYSGLAACPDGRSVLKGGIRCDGGAIYSRTAYVRQFGTTPTAGADPLTPGRILMPTPQNRGAHMSRPAYINHPSAGVGHYPSESANCEICRMTGLVDTYLQASSSASSTSSAPAAWTVPVPTRTNRPSRTNRAVVVRSLDDLLAEDDEMGSDSAEEID